MPAGEARPGSLPVEIEAVARRAAMMTCALKLEIGEPDRLLVSANVKINEVWQKKKNLQECGLRQYHQQRKPLGQLHQSNPPIVSQSPQTAQLKELSDHCPVYIALHFVFDVANHLLFPLNSSSYDGLPFPSSLLIVYEDD